jgi:hypothetical protein
MRVKNILIVKQRSLLNIVWHATKDFRVYYYMKKIKMWCVTIVLIFVENVNSILEKTLKIKKKGYASFVYENIFIQKYFFTNNFRYIF